MRSSLRVPAMWRRGVVAVMMVPRSENWMSRVLGPLVNRVCWLWVVVVHPFRVAVVRHSSCWVMVLSFVEGLAVYGPVSVVGGPDSMRRLFLPSTRRCLLLWRLAAGSVRG